MHCKAVVSAAVHRLARQTIRHPRQGRISRDAHRTCISVCAGASPGLRRQREPRRKSAAASLKTSGAEPAVIDDGRRTTRRRHRRRRHRRRCCRRRRNRSRRTPTARRAGRRGGRGRSRRPGGRRRRNAAARLLDGPDIGIATSREGALIRRTGTARGRPPLPVGDPYRRKLIELITQAPRSSRARRRIRRHAGRPTQLLVALPKGRCEIKPGARSPRRLIRRQPIPPRLHSPLFRHRIASTGPRVWRLQRQPRPPVNSRMRVPGEVSAGPGTAMMNSDPLRSIA